MSELIKPESPQIQKIGASVAANALTISAAALSLDFRSSTLGSGGSARVSGTPANLVVPSGATLGTVSTVASRIVVLALNNSGSPELAVINIAGGNDLTETGLISTTAISAAATAANVAYSTTARTNVAYRVLGFVDSTQAAAGTWATAPSKIQGAGGLAMADMSSLGFCQTWQVFTPGTNRVLGTTYYNTTGKPILVSIMMFASAAGAGHAYMTINGVQAAHVVAQYAAQSYPQMVGIVPPGGSYVVTVLAPGAISEWTELR